MLHHSRKLCSHSCFINASRGGRPKSIRLLTRNMGDDAKDIKSNLPESPFAKLLRKKSAPPNTAAKPHYGAGNAPQSQGSAINSDSVFGKLLNKTNRDAPTSHMRRPAPIPRQTPAAPTPAPKPAPPPLPPPIPEPSIGSSVRDAFRRAAEKQKQPPPPPPPPRSARVQQPTPDIDVDDGTPFKPSAITGEARYERRLTNLEHKRQKLQHKLPEKPHEKYVKNKISPTPTQDGEEYSDDDDSDVDEEEVEEYYRKQFEDSDSDAGSDVASEDVSQHLTQADLPQFTEVKGRMASVAELKRIAAERLAIKKEITPEPVKIVTRAEERKLKRREIVNMLKRKKALKRLQRKPRKAVFIKTDLSNKQLTLSGNGMPLIELANSLGVSLEELVRRFEELGEEVNYDDADAVVDADVIELFALENQMKIMRKVSLRDDSYMKTRDTTAELLPRDPVVCVLGHVDHGKTTLIDSIKKSYTKEAGGITQHINAFKIQYNDRSAVFFDTPGHEAFNSMRSNSLLATDIVIIVISMDDGVRPQTLEALKIAKANNCQMIIALNKVDKIPSSDKANIRSKILTGLVELEIVPEDFGGDVPVVEISGKTGFGVDALLETLSFQSDILALKAPVDDYCEAYVIDAKVDRGLGIVADVLVRWGSLNIGDPVVVYTTFGKVRAMIDVNGQKIKRAGPSSVVKLIGLKGVPLPGQELLTIPSEDDVKKIVDRRLRIESTKKEQQRQQDMKQEEEQKSDIVVPVILKADTLLALDALKFIVQDISDRCKDVHVKILRSSIGEVTETDVETHMEGHNALVLALSTPPLNSKIKNIAKRNDVTIVTNDVIYRLEDALKEFMVDCMPRQKTLSLLVRYSVWCCYVLV